MPSRRARARCLWPAAVLIIVACSSAVIGAVSAVDGSGDGLDASDGAGVVELGQENYTEALTKLEPGGHVLMEFYANWCPHCRHFKPTYENIGRFFMSEPRVLPEVFVARVDCALKPNADICTHFDVKYYPTVKFGAAGDFAAEKGDLVQDVRERDEEGIVDSVGTKLNATYQYVLTRPLMPPKIGGPIYQTLPRAEANGEVDINDVERATAEVMDSVLLSDLLATSEHKSALVAWLTLLASSHPSARCLAGAQELLSSLDSVWPDGADLPSPQLKTFHICGKNFEAQPWGSCSGSRADTRGLTCGIWLLLHSLANRVTVDYGGVMWMKGVSAFVKHFFQCKHCAQHFSQILASPGAQRVVTRSDVIIWLWETHNKVNARLAGEEEVEGTKDLMYPKSQWPLRDMCSSCVREAPDNRDGEPAWNRQAVQAYLQRFYGDGLVTEKHAVVDERTQPQAIVSSPPKFVRPGLVSPPQEVDVASPMPGGYEPFALLLIVVAVVFAARSYKKKSKGDMHFL